jgi:hypothetical protein
VLFSSVCMRAAMPKLRRKSPWVTGPDTVPAVVHGELFAHKSGEPEKKNLAKWKTSGAAVQSSRLPSRLPCRAGQNLVNKERGEMHRAEETWSKRCTSLCLRNAWAYKSIKHALHTNIKEKPNPHRVLFQVWLPVVDNQRVALINRN